MEELGRKKEVGWEDQSVSCGRGYAYAMPCPANHKPLATISQSECHLERETWTKT